MGERITEAELREWEADASPHMRKFGTPERRLIAEVRRLRELIVAPFPGHPALDWEALLAIEAEARAIREEQASLDKRA